MRNPLTQITGPEFLWFFAILIATVAVLCWLRRRTQDNSLRLSPAEPVDEIDPYEVAYLRGQRNELARVLILRLVELKYLQIKSHGTKWWRTFDVGRSIEHAPNHPPVTRLSPMEQAAFSWFETPRSPGTVFTTLSAELVTHAAEYERKLRSRSLFTTEELKSMAHRTIAIGVAIVLMIGLTRIVIGISRDKPVAFLVLMGVLGIPAIVRAGQPGRLSRRGHAYLDSVRTRWKELRHPTAEGDWSPTLAAGVFGVGVLAGTEWSPVADTFRRARSHSYSGTTGACGAACGGGGDGGGGGGGCGGGCGGCGGS
jgi:uncharacterized protein (TIGR04222 family)